MPLNPSRRATLTGAAAALAASPALAADDRLAALERRVGGRLGVAALDVASGRRLAWRAGERFRMCSTFKLMAAAAVLARIDRGRERGERMIRFGRADLLSHAPVARAHVGEGALPLLTLCQAAVEVSDNTAANLILAELGGPGAVTAFVRTLGDPTTRLDRNEPGLNTGAPDDPRDTTSPAAMLGDVRAVVLGGVLAPASRERLQSWMIACRTGLTRLRAGLPAGWRAGDKTGTGPGGTANDIAVVWSPRGPIVITSYLTGAAAVGDAARDAVHADVARIVIETLGHG